MKNLGIECQDINQILLTHMHEDHVGGMLLGGNPVFINSSISVSDKDITVIGIHVPVPQPEMIVKDETSGKYKFLPKVIQTEE